MRIIDLFSGCGGLSLGFQNAGFNVVAAYDFWQPAVDVYRLNFKDHPIFNFDLSDVDNAVKHIKEWNPEVIIGGPPCQDFSHAGNRQEGQRANLTEAFAMIVKKISPTWFVMENVDRAQKSQAYLKARGIFIEAGYGLCEHVFDASLCGVPQKRKRFICIGRKNTPMNFLDDNIKNNLRTSSMTMREYFGDSLGIDYYYRHPRNYNRRGIFSMDEPSPTIRGVNRPIPNGYKGHHGDPVPVSAKVSPLSTSERAQVQTFPVNFQWIGSKTNLEQIIGNAVPVKLAEFIAQRIVHYHNFGSNVSDVFKDWLLSNKKLSKASVRDVLSRLNRVSNLIEVNQGDDSVDLAYKLDKNEKYSSLSKSVQSQLKRAVSLDLEFRESYAEYNV